MPAKSQKQANLMRAAAHGADFPKAREIRASMSPGQIKDFTKLEHESHRYDWRKQNNLKQNRGK